MEKKSFHLFAHTHPLGAWNNRNIKFRFVKWVYLVVLWILARAIHHFTVNILQIWLQGTDVSCGHCMQHFVAHTWPTSSGYNPLAFVFLFWDSNTNISHYSLSSNIFFTIPHYSSLLNHLAWHLCTTGDIQVGHRIIFSVYLALEGTNVHLYTCR